MDPVVSHLDPIWGVHSNQLVNPFRIIPPRPQSANLIYGHLRWKSITLQVHVGFWSISRTESSQSACFAIVENTLRFFMNNSNKIKNIFIMDLGASVKFCACNICTLIWTSFETISDDTTTPALTSHMFWNRDKPWIISRFEVQVNID